MTGNSQHKIGALLLAAGGSKRMGRPKQLLVWEGKTLLRRAAEMLSDSVCDPIVVVLGSERVRSATELEGLRTRTCANPGWETGMSSSIKHGLRELLEIEPTLTAVIITLCDQPEVDASDINDLVDKFRETGAPIVAAQYGAVTGVPALFANRMFGSLFDLKGDKGAREVIRNGAVDVVTLDMEQAAFDIDTPEDAQAYQK